MMINAGRRAPPGRHEGAKDRRERRLRSEARLRLQLCRAARIAAHRGGHDSRVNTTHTSATQTCEHFDLHDDDAGEQTVDTDAERIMEQTVDVPVPQAREGFEIMAPALTAARKRRRAKVAPTPADACAAADPVTEDDTYSPAVAYAAPIPVIDSVAPSPVVTCPALAPARREARDRKHNTKRCTEKMCWRRTHQLTHLLGEVAQGILLLNLGEVEG